MKQLSFIMSIILLSFFLGAMSSVNRSFGQDPCLTPSPTIETYTTFRMTNDRNIRSCPTLTCKIVGTVTVNQIVSFKNIQTDRLGYTWGELYDGTWIAIQFKNTLYANAIQ